MYYTITFERDFLGPIVGMGGHGNNIEFKIYKTTDRDFAIEWARRMNNDPTINIQIERFRVWGSTAEKSIKKASLIYPSKEYPLF